MELDDAFYMVQCLEQARQALALDEVPIGCVIAYEGQIIGQGCNLRNTNKNPLHHAEILAIEQACTHMGDWRLENTTLYVTVEPCPMCAGAIVQARIPRVVFATRNPKAGCGGSILNILNHPAFNHQVEVVEGVLAEESQTLLKTYFKQLREKRKEEAL